MWYGRQLLLRSVAVVLLVGSVTLAVSVSGNGLHAALAQSQSSVTARDFSIPAGSDPWGTSFDSSGHVWVAIPGCDAAPRCNAGTPPGKLAEYNPATSSWMASYQLPAGYGQALFLAFDGQGRVWFAMPMDNAIGMLDPATNTFQQWGVPTANAGPWDVAIDHTGKIWFSEFYTNKIGRFDPGTHTFLEVATAAANSQPYGIVVDGSNNVWFTENNSSVAQIGEYTAGGKMQEYKIRTGSTNGLTPHLITVDTGGNIWWSEGWVGMIGKLTVGQAVPGTTKGVTEYAYPRVCNTCSTHTSGIGVDRNGLVWFDDADQGIYGSFPESGAGSFATYPAPTASGHPYDGLAVDGQNRIWFDEEFANKVAEVTQSGVPTPTHSITPTPTVTPSPGITLAQDTFHRTNQKHWGKASNGQTWGGDANNSNVFSISGNTGKIANGSTSYSALLGPLATNAHVLFSGSLSNFNSTNLGSILRWTDGNNWYKAYIDGSNLVVQKKVNGSTSVLGQVAFAASAGKSYTLRFSASGTTLSAKVWQTGKTEPTNWMVKVTDNSLHSGFCGLRMLVQNSAIATFTSFIAISQ